MTLRMSRRHFSIMLAAAAAPVSFKSALAADKPRTYVVVDIGVLDGGDYSIGNAINGKGKVAGMATVMGGSQAITHGDGLVALGQPGVTSSANGINNDGEVVGFISSAELGGQRAIRWDENGETDLGTLGGPFSIAHGINDKGDVVGESTIGEADGAYSHAFLWHKNELSDLGTLGGDYSIAKGINDDGLVAGLSTVEPGQQPYGPGCRAVLWGKDGLVDLGALGGDVAAAFAVNKKGWVAGGATTENGIEYGGTGTHAFIWKDGEMIDLGAFDGADYSMANDLNDKGEVVGFAGNPNAATPDASMAAALWDTKGQLINLNDMIPADSGWFLSTAVSINNKGEITGLGISNGVYRGFVLKPKG